MIYTDFSEIADRFDTLLVDAYGVFWGGKTAIPNSLETMAEQVRQGKKVCILSNTTLREQDSINNYTKRGVEKGVHYTDIVTSGEVFYDTIVHDKLPFRGNRFFVVGTRRWVIDDNNKFQVVSTPEEADMAFFGTPQLTGEQLVQIPDFRDKAFRVSGATDHYDITTVEPFLPILEHLLRLDLPAVGTNPDQIVLENGHWVIREGALFKAYRDMGGRVAEFGKPYKNIFEYAFRKLQVEPSKRVAMIGDTFRTDIKGALDSGITPVWCLDYGVAQYELSHGHSLEDQAGGSLDGIILLHHL